MSLSQFVKWQEVNAPYNLDFFRDSMPCRKEFSFEPIIRGLKKKMPPFSHPLGKLARQMLAKSSADAHYLQRGEERSCHEINHTDSSIKKKKITIYYSCCFSRAGKKLDRGSQICIWVLYLPIITIWIPKVPLFNEIWCYTDMTDSLNTLFFFFFLYFNPELALF